MALTAATRDARCMVFVDAATTTCFTSSSPPTPPPLCSRLPRMLPRERPLHDVRKRSQLHRTSARRKADRHHDRSEPQLKSLPATHAEGQCHLESLLALADSFKGLDTACSTGTETCGDLRRPLPVQSQEPSAARRGASLTGLNDSPPLPPPPNFQGTQICLPKSQPVPFGVDSAEYRHGSTDAPDWSSHTGKACCLLP